MRLHEVMDYILLNDLIETHGLARHPDNIYHERGWRQALTRGKDVPELRSLRNTNWNTLNKMVYRIGEAKRREGYFTNRNALELMHRHERGL